MSSPSRSDGAQPLWAPCILAAIAWGCAVLMALAHGLHWTYRPWGGVLGHPTYLDYAPGQEKFHYFGGLCLIAVLGMFFVKRASRSRHGAALALSFLGSGVVAAACVTLLMPGPAANLAKAIIRAPLALAEILALGMMMLVLAAGGSFFRPASAGTEPADAPALLAHRKRIVADDWADMLSRGMPSFLLVLVLGVAFIPDNTVALLLAIVFAVAFERIYRPLERPRKGLNAVACLEAVLWFFAGAVLPALGWWIRLRMNKGQGLPDPRVPVLMLFIALGLILLVGMMRRRMRIAPLIHPAWLVAFAVFTIMSVGMGQLSVYDAFHEGEYIYSAHAIRKGLLPWRDIFYVHGFGVNTLPGWLAGRPRLHLYSLDIIVICVAGAISAALACWLMLGMWGRRWWLAVLAIAALCGGYSPTASYRYIVVWIVLLLAMGFLKRGRLRWLVLAGAATVGACLYTLDLGAVLVLSVPVWLLLWRGWRPGGVFARRRAVHWLMPLLAWLLGLTLAGLVFLAWLWAHGMVADFFALHLEYLRAKSHADKIPFDLNHLSIMFSPLVSLLGVWASGLILRRGDRSPLAGFIVLLTVINILVFSRALDRSDAGHIVYATVPAWILLASLIVWRCREITPSAALLSREALTRSSLLLVLILAMPYLHPLIRDDRGPRASLTIALIDWIRFYPDSVRRDLMREPEDAISRDFFDLAAQLHEIVYPGDGFYDFSNQPAIYAWTGTVSPTRFYATYYAYGGQWQREVVDALESKNVRWVLWKGPNPYFNAPDGVFNFVRQWRIARYILAHYRPAYRLAGGSLLAERVGGRETASGEAPAVERDWVRLGWIPQVWGRSQAGVPPVPERIAWSLEETAIEGTLSFEPPAEVQPGQADPVREIFLYFDPPVEGVCEILWWGGAKGYLNFNLREGYAGPYRVTLDNMPGWVWGGPVNDMQVKVAGETVKDVRVRLEFRH